MILAVIANHNDRQPLTVILSSLMVQGHIIFHPVPHLRSKSENLVSQFEAMQKQAIDLSDGIYVIDFNKEITADKAFYIQYAEQSGKLIYYHSQSDWKMMDIDIGG